MNKKQLVGVSTVAAIPAIGLLVMLIIGLTQGMLSASPSPSAALWTVWVLAVLGSVVIGFLPVAIMIFPGLLPEPGTAAAVAPSTGPDRRAPSDESDEDAEEEFGDVDDEEATDEGDDEQMFDEALDDDFDDDLGDFEDDEKQV